MTVPGVAFRIRNASAVRFRGSKLKLHDFFKINDFSKIMTFLDAHVLENARGSSLARISLPCGVAFHTWCEALLSVVVL